MDNAAILGAEILLIIPGNSLHDQDIEEARSLNMQSIEIICQYSRDYDFQLGLEPANPFVTDLVNTAADAMEIIQKLNRENLGIVLDTGHMNLVNELPQDSIDILGDRLLQIHINDNDGKQQQNLVPGEGIFRFNDFLQSLMESGFEGNISAELGWHYTPSPEQPAKLTAQYLRNWIRNWA